MSEELTLIRPQIGFQRNFLSSPADIVIAGSGAGVGKSYALLMEPMRHVYNPLFRAAIFRRTRPRLTNPGGLWDTSQQIYPLIEGAKQNVQLLRWDFPSGAQLQFSHLQYEADKHAWQGTQLAFIGWDELTEFSAGQFWYLLSRNRSVSGVKPYVRATCNPDPDSFVADLVDWYIADDGYANLERCGQLRYFTRLNNEIHWASSKEELAHIQPFHDLIKSFTFIPGVLEDNQELLSKDPGYKANLLALDEVQKERLLGDSKRGGNWKIRPAAGLVFHKDNFRIRNDFNVLHGAVVTRYWDFAATEKDMEENIGDESDAPSETASCLVAYQAGMFYVIDMSSEFIGPADIDELWFQTSLQDAAWAQDMGWDYSVSWEEEGGSAGKRVSQQMMTKLALRGISGLGIKSTADKYVRARPAAILVKAKRVTVMQAPWNDRFIMHLHNQPSKRQDIMDSFSGAINYLQSEDANHAQWGELPFPNHRG